ncbi:hypothetical protein QTP88_004473 [Uroleucon formosanum]
MSTYFLEECIGKSGHVPFVFGTTSIVFNYIVLLLENSLWASQRTIELPCYRVKFSTNNAEWRELMLT